MGRNKKDFNDRVQSYPVSLTNSQIMWLDAHPDFKVHKFVRDKLEEYRKLREVKSEEETEQTRD